MPQQTQRRKNLTTLQATDDVVVLPEVHASLNVQAKRRDISGIMNALGTLQGKFARTAAENREKKSDEDKQKGIRDANLGEVDEELEKNSKAYRDGRLEQRAAADGLEWFNTKREELQAKLIDDPDFFTADNGEKYQAFKKQALEEYLGSRTDPASMRMANGMTNRLLETLDSTFYAGKAKLEIAESENDFGRLVSEAHRAGAVKSADDLKALIAKGDALTGIDKEGATRIAFNALLTDLEDGNVELAKILRPHVQDNPQLNRLLDQAEEHGVATNKRKEAEALAERVSKDTVFWNGLEADIHAGRNVARKAQWAVDNGYADAKEAANWISQSKSRAEQLAEDARKRAKDAEQDLMILKALQQGNGRVLDDDKSKKVLNSQFSSAFFAMQDAIDKNDPKAAREAGARVGSVIALAQKNGMIPEGFEKFLSNVDYSDPVRLKRVGEFYRAFAQTKGLQSYLAAHLPAETHARLQFYSRGIDNGSTPEQMSQQVTRARQVDPSDARDQVTARKKEIEAAARDIAGGQTNGYQYARTELINMASVYTTMGMDPKDAIAQAREDVKDRSIKFGNVVVPRKTVASEDAGKVASEYVKWVAMPQAQKDFPGAYEDTDELTFLPVPEMPGRFILVDKGSMRPYLGRDGKTVIKSEVEMRAEAASGKSKRAAEAAAQAPALMKAMEEDPEYIRFMNMK